MPFTVKPSNPFATPVTATFGDKPSRGTEVPYFPPPPTTIDTKTKSNRQSKPPPLSDQPLKLPFTVKNHKRSGRKHVIGYPTQARKKRVQEVVLPPLELSPRHWTLVLLLLLSFLVLILGFIFADCVALPHTDNHSDLASGGTGTANVSLYIRDVGIGLKSRTTLDVGRRDEGSDDDGASSPTQPSSVPPSQSNTSTPSEYLANESKELGFTSPRNLAILFFYTFTLPLLTILHAIVELAALLFPGHSLKSSAGSDVAEDNDTDSITKMKTSSLAKKYGPSRSLNLQTNKSCLGRLSPYLPALSLTTSIILPLGWIVINTIQAHCEISPAPLAHADLASAQKICPVQVRGHFMNGINELSIAKNVSGWVLVLVYIVYAVMCAKLVGLAGRKKREEARMKELEGQREVQLRESERRNTIVRFSLGIGKKGREESTETVEEVELEDRRNRDSGRRSTHVGFAV